MSWKERMAHIGQPESVGRSLAGLDWFRLCGIVPVATSQDVGGEHLLIATEFRLVGNLVGPDIDDLHCPVSVASAGGGKQPCDRFAGRPERLLQRFGLID